MRIKVAKQISWHSTRWMHIKRAGVRHTGYGCTLVWTTPWDLIQQQQTGKICKRERKCDRMEWKESIFEVLNFDMAMERWTLNTPSIYRLNNSFWCWNNMKTFQRWNETINTQNAIRKISHVVVVVGGCVFFFMEGNPDLNAMHCELWMAIFHISVRLRFTLCVDFGALFGIYSLYVCRIFPQDVAVQFGYRDSKLS